MKKLIIFSLMLLLLLFTGVVDAAGLPAKGTDHIYDTASMFPKSQLTDLEKAASSGSSYGFYILTIDSLENESAEAYAHRVYDTWSLNVDDVLVLLSKQDRRIQIYFVNPPLQQKLDALPKNYAGEEYESRGPIDRIVGKQFTPFAKQGDFVSGLINLITAANDLPDPHIEKDPVSSAAQLPSTPQRAVEPELPAPIVQESSNQVIIMILLIVLLVGVAGTTVFLLIRYKKRLMGKASIIESAESVSVKILHAQEKMAPLLSLYSGPATEENLIPLSKVIDSRAEKVQELIRNVNSMRIGFFTGKALENLDKYNDMVNTYRVDSDGYLEKVEYFISLDRSNAKAVNDIRAALQAVKEKADRMSKETSLSLAQVKDEIATNEKRIKDAYDLQLTDLIDVTEVLAPQYEQTCRQAQLLEELPSLLEFHKRLPERINETDQDIKGKMLQRGLQVVEFNPFLKTEEARSGVHLLGSALAKGDLQEASRISAATKDNLVTANEMVEERMKLRDSLDRNILHLKEFIESFSLTEAGYQSEIEKIQRQFSSDVWGTMAQRYERAIQAYNEVESGLQQVDVLYLEQRFTALRSWIEGLLKKAEIASKEAEIILSTHQVASKRLNGFISESEAVWRRFQTSKSLIPSHSIPPERNHDYMIQTILENKNALDRLVVTLPVDLAEIESVLGQFDGIVRTFTEKIERVVREKQSAENRLKEVRDRFQTVSARTSSRSISGHYSLSYQSDMNKIENFIMLGLYTEAMNHMNDAENNIQLMQNAYDQIIRDEQRRQEEERMRQIEEQRRQDEARRQQESVNSFSSGGDSYSSSSGSSGGDNW